MLFREKTSTHALTSTGPNPDLLVVGDSWASLGRLDAGLKRGSGMESGSLGFPGKTAGQVAKAVLTLPDLPDADTVILLVGLNDAANHVGVRAYRNGVERLRRLLARPGRRVLLAEIPPFAGAPRTLRSIAKQQFMRHIVDGGRSGAAHYRAAVEANILLGPLLTDRPNAFAPDGYHLTSEAFDGLGEYLGRQVSGLRADQAVCNQGVVV